MSSVQTRTVCPRCDGSLTEWTKVDSYRLDRCVDCGYVFVNPPPSSEAIRDHYRTGGGHGKWQLASAAEVVAKEREFPNTTVDAKRMLSRAKALTQGTGSLLDVGCGYGLISAEAHRQGFTVTAIEIAAHERAIATEMLGWEPRDVSFEDFPEDAAFDVIVMSQVLEHAVAVNLWLAKAYRLLVPGGVLCIAVPNFSSFTRRLLGRRDPFIIPPAHLNYFSSQNLRLALVKNRFHEPTFETVSRVPYDVISKRLPDGAHRLRRIAYLLAKYAQRPVFSLADPLQMGMFLQAYARR